MVSHLISQPLSIHVHHPSLQPISENPCLSKPCQHICLLSPTAAAGYTCKCRPGYRTTSVGQCAKEEMSFLMVMRGSQIVDVSLTPGDKTAGFLTAVVGIDYGIQIDYDRKTDTLFWLEGKEEDEENVSCFNSLFSIYFLFLYSSAQL